MRTMHSSKSDKCRNAPDRERRGGTDRPRLMMTGQENETMNSGNIRESLEVSQESQRVDIRPISGKGSDFG